MEDVASQDQFWDSLNDESRNVEKSIDQKYRRSNGCYYTDLFLAKKMIDDLFLLMDEQELSKISKKTFLEPCVGSGIFVFAYLKKISELKLSYEDNFNVVNNIYFADVNEISLNYFQRKLTEFVKIFFNISLGKEYFDTHCAKGLLFNLNEKKVNYIRIEDVFSDVSKFDIIATNPPYKNLKAERDQYGDEESYCSDKKLYEDVAKISKKILKKSSVGVLNLYKLFVEEIITNYTTKDAIVSLLIPNTILSDKSCTDLRTHIIKTGRIHSVSIIGEDSSVVDAQQGLCMFLYRRGQLNDQILITKDYSNNPGNCVAVKIEDILNEKTGNSIFAVNEQEYDLLKKLRKFPTLSDFSFIKNLRGELDLTQEKKSIVKGDTGYKLIRGRNISKYKTNYDVGEFVDPSFIKRCTKKDYILKKRIACQQIVNLQKEERLCFSLIDENVVLGNSCNFLSVESNEYDLDIYALLGLMNSPQLNWIFNLTSSNNHVNNYELDALPLPLNKKYLSELSILVKKYLESHSVEDLNNIREKTDQMFNSDCDIRKQNSSIELNALEKRFYADLSNIISDLSEEDAQQLYEGNNSIKSYLANNGGKYSDIERKACIEIVEKYSLLKNNKVMNHIEFKLSDLDLEMIKSIPQGGNWTNIPEETVAKSERLKQITLSGGRTTLYGRLDYDAPSYTISTYFNRPGNGTYVHPRFDRVITPREAARFQSFPDDYYFTGNKGAVLKQIGNAVPVKMAESIAKSIISKTGCTKTIDLFCGAGGMTKGFKNAGMKSLLSNDFNEDACVTLKTNNPEIPVLCADITDGEVKDAIVNVAIEKGADIVCGGPPCQGFSLAGKRFIDDPRNQLFKHFIEVVSRIKPKIVIMENVEGMLSFSNGDIYKEIIQLYNDLGYLVEGRILIATDYGVPQKRKRVIIIGTRCDLNIEPSSLYPSKINVSVTAKDVLKDLETVELGSNATYANVEISDYVKSLKEVKQENTNIKIKNMCQTTLF